jgi:hypothetical protein
MEGPRPQPPPAHVSISGPAAPTLAAPCRASEELRLEELDERLTPGSGIVCLIKKTAGWGC